MPHRRADIVFVNPPVDDEVEMTVGHSIKKVAVLTAGGLAPCLSSAVGGLITKYTEVDPSIEIIMYKDGYKGLLKRDFVVVDDVIRSRAHLLHLQGGSPCGNSRVKLTNKEDCEKRGLVRAGQDPQQVAADNLVNDGVQVLHTIGGDDTNIAAADLAKYLANNQYALQVIGLAKTIDNDVYPIQQSLGAWTAAEEGANFFSNVVYEHSSNPRMLIVHEVMGRACGWLTAATALNYQNQVDNKELCLMSRNQLSVHGIYIPEYKVDLESEGRRLKKIMDEHGCVNIFISEGAGVDAVIAQKVADGEEIVRDAFGHVKLDSINLGHWFGDQLKKVIGAEKVMVQKSGYFARSAPANKDDISLIRSCTDRAVYCALRGDSGVMGNDDQQCNKLRCIEFERIAGGKPFCGEQSWFQVLVSDIGQVMGEKQEVTH